MVYVGIDVAKDKHDCFIVNSEGEVLYDVWVKVPSQELSDAMVDAFKDKLKDM